MISRQELPLWELFHIPPSQPLTFWWGVHLRKRMTNLFMTGSPLWQNEADPSYVLMGEIGLFCQLRFPTLFLQEKKYKLCLWRLLPHRLSRRQSVSTTVLTRTTLTTPPPPPPGQSYSTYLWHDSWLQTIYYQKHSLPLGHTINPW